jgi:hypothetical protein
MAGNCLGVVAAIVVITSGWLGDVIIDKHSMNVFSGVLIAVGNSTAAVKSGDVSIITSRIIHGFGLGIIISTLPAYASQSRFSLLKGVSRSSLCVLLGNIMIRYARNHFFGMGLMFS